MPSRLIKGYSRKSMAANYKELSASKTKRPHKQKVAIILSVAREAARARGKPSKGPKPPKRKGRNSS